MWGFAAVGVGIVGCLVIVVAGRYAQIGDPDGFLDTWLGPLQMLAIYPAVVLAAALVVILVRRRRDI